MPNISPLPISPNGEISHNDVRVKINQIITEIALPPIQLTTKQDAIDNGTVSGEEITLNKGAYLIGDLDMGADTLVVEGGSVLIGTSSDLSMITSSNATATVLFKNGGFIASGMIGQAGIKVNNSGTGASIKVFGSGTICFFNNLYTNQGSLALLIENASGVGVTNYTIVNGTDGIRMIGAANSGLIVNNFNPINCAGKAADIQGDIINGALRFRDANISCAGNGVEVSGSVQGISLTGEITSTGGNAIKVSGTAANGILIDSMNAISTFTDSVDITGSSITSFLAQNAGMISTASGGVGLKGDANNANISVSATCSVCYIDGPENALSGITKKDTSWSFFKAGPKITDSRNIGSFNLLSPASSIIIDQGADGVITSYADGGVGITTVTSAGHGLSDGQSIVISGTASYNGVFTISATTANTFNITRAFISDEGVGDWESGWVKVGGTTLAGETIERFSMSDNNELTSLDQKELPVTVSVSISGSKSGATPNQYQFAVFQDKNAGTGFEKINGSLIGDFSNRGGSLSGRVPLTVILNSRVSIYVRNMDGATNFDAVGLSVDIGLS